jgi:hypothetical protein
MMTAATLAASAETIEKPVIPAYLIKEVLDGKPLYYKGYKEVLNHNKTLEEIMGSSSLQAEIITYLLEVILLKIGRKKYRIYTNEIGSHISHKNNISHDIAIFDKTILTPDKINERYTEVPAKVIIEVDVRIEAEQFPEWDYVTQKNETVFAFGTEKAIWILTKSQKVIVAQPGADWLIIDWNKDIELLDGHHFNIGNYLQNEGIQLETL